MVQHTHGVYFVRFIKHVSKIIALQVNIITLTLQAWFARVSRLRIYIYQIVCIRYRLNTGRWLADRRQPWSKAMEDGGATHFKLGSLFMLPFSSCCTRITNSFKHGRYSNRSNAFIQHGRFDLRMENSWLRVMYCKIFKVDSDWLEQDTYLINHYNEYI